MRATSMPQVAQRPAGFHACYAGASMRGAERSEHSNNKRRVLYCETTTGGQRTCRAVTSFMALEP